MAMQREIPAPRPSRKRLVRRTAPDRSQQTRRLVQALFVALNVAIGVQFLLWVRSFDRPGALQVSRPAGVDGWLPIAGLMNFKYLISTGRVPAVHPAALFLLMAFLIMSLVLKKAFCSWLCPVGTLSEFLWKLGRKLFRRSFALPHWLDLPLRGLKYILLGFFAIIIGSMSAGSLDEFMHAPYALVADVKMLNFFLHIGVTAGIVVALLVILSFLVENFWCRYLCPYGALMGLVSLLSPFKIRRALDACIDCGKCARVCPSHLPVDRLVQIRSAECTACMACGAECSVQGGLPLSLPPWRNTAPEQRWTRRAVAPLVVAALLASIFFGFTAYAKVTGHWQTEIPRSVYQELVTSAENLSHPGN